MSKRTRPSSSDEPHEKPKENSDEKQPKPVREKGPDGTVHEPELDPKPEQGPHFEREPEQAPEIDYQDGKRPGTTHPEMDYGKRRRRRR